ncbi:MAG TPA: hypothetical protein VMU29_02790 [Smithella sp.]|nr:hypothetical protein [Smithella sp.]
MKKNQSLHLVLKLIFIISIFTVSNGCFWLDKTLTKALTTSANVRMEKIDRSKAIVKYDRGALIEANGEEEATKEMAKYCSPKDYKTLISGERVSGEKRWTKTVVFECVITK